MSCPDVELLKSATLMLAAGVEAGAALVIGLAAIEALIRALAQAMPRDPRGAFRGRFRIRVKVVTRQSRCSILDCVSERHGVLS